MSRWVVSDIYEPEGQDTKAENEDKLTIDKWSDEDKPREKMLRLGPESMSSAELLAILMRSGRAQKDGC
jgi:DNA repair protein RadC